MIKDRSLTPAIFNIIRNKATEKPFSGEYNVLLGKGTYLCRGCGLALFRGDSQFLAHCGWPSFDIAIQGAVQEQLDTDGRRIEIVCSRCLAHLGHVFDGERYTANNRRFCVNSMSLDFIEHSTALDTEEAIVAGGCFWGMQYLFDRLPGVLKTEVGYIGGALENPAYQVVCMGNTGHYEAIRIIYDKDSLNYETVIKYFLEIHDPTQVDGQGPDKGSQYLSAVFYFNESQQKITQLLIEQLKQKGLAIVTSVLPMRTFWSAESFHQHYYEKTGENPYCHFYTKRF